MFSVYPSVRRVRYFVRSSGQILLPRFLINGLRNLDESYRKSPLAPTDDMVNTTLNFGGQRSRSQQAVEVAKASMSKLERQNIL